MDFKKFFSDEVQKSKKENEARKDKLQAEEEVRSKREAERIRSRQQFNVSLHNQLKPILVQFVQATKLELLDLGPQPDHGCFHEYRINQVTQKGLFRSSREFVMTIHFMETSQEPLSITGTIWSLNYTKDDLLDTEKIKIRFAHDLMRHGKYYIK